MLAMTVPAIACAQGEAWPMYGLSESRVPVVSGDADASTLDAPAWTLESLPTLGALSVPTPTGPVSDGTRVFFMADVAGTHRLVAADIETGAPLWDAVIDPPSQDSWSSPAVDLTNSTVLTATGAEFRAHDAATGAVLWAAPLPRSVVNASPLVTSDRGAADRALIVSADGSFVTLDGGVLHAVNVDPFDAVVNPFQPGDIVWSLPLEAAASGASVSYTSGVVFVADSGDPFFGLSGAVRAFDITGSTPSELWATEAPSGGYFGGVAIAGDAVFAATYVFSGGTTAATLSKLDAQTGAELWSVPCNRTSGVPVPLPDDRVLLSGGIDGFGTLPSIEVFDDLGMSAAPALSSIQDAPTLSLGGWTHLPAVLDNGSGLIALVGTLPASGSLFGAYDELRLLDLSLPASDPAFVIDSYSGCGSTPIVADGRLLTLGPSGLFAFELAGSSLIGDIDGNGIVDLEDQYAWHQKPGSRIDVNGDGEVTFEDSKLIEAIAREGEDDMLYGGRR